MVGSFEEELGSTCAGYDRRPPEAVLQRLKSEDSGHVLH